MKFALIPKKKKKKKNKSINYSVIQLLVQITTEV